MSLHVLVTGASRGLGRALAADLSARGDDVVATSRDGSTGTTLDLTSDTSIAALATALAARGRTIDVLVNNAAIFEGTRADVLATNFFGTLAVTDALVPSLKEGGRIVNVSSGMGELAGASPSLQATLMDPGLTRQALDALVRRFVVDGSGGWPAHPYSASKLAENALTRVLARELSPRRIRVHAVCPGWCRTDMGGRAAPRSVDEGARSIRAAVLDETEDTGFFRDGRRIPW
jgi:NAD(P)-dependent dehydrogenase (short-subunit alcohol dehydrogenase family)